MLWQKNQKRHEKEEIVRIMKIFRKAVGRRFREVFPEVRRPLDHPLSDDLFQLLSSLFYKRRIGSAGVVKMCIQFQLIVRREIPGLPRRIIGNLTGYEWINGIMKPYPVFNKPWRCQ